MRYLKGDNRMKSAYDGDGRFVFFSYSHEDENLVSPFFDALSEKFKVWHDKDIPLGSEWEDIILEHIKNSCLFLFCVTPNSLTSEYCKKEVMTAIDNKIAFLSVIIDRINEMPEPFKKMYDQYQACNLFEHSTYKDAISELERRNSAIHIALREQYQDKNKNNKKDDYKIALADALPRNKFEGIRAVGSFEDFDRLMNNDYDILDDLEFSTPYLPKEIFDKCVLHQNINPEYKALLGICYQLGIGADVDLTKAVELYFEAIKEKNNLPKNMKTIILWNLVAIYENIMSRNPQDSRIDTTGLSHMTFGDLSKIMSLFRRASQRYGNYEPITPEEIIQRINESTNLSSVDRAFLLARVELKLYGNKEKAAKIFDEAIANGSEVAVIFKTETYCEPIEQMKFRMFRGYSRFYGRYAKLLKEAGTFDLTDKEQWAYCLNSARLGNADAIMDIYESFYLNKNKNPLDDSLMNFLFEQGIEKGSGRLIQTQLGLLKGQKGLNKNQAKRIKILQKLDKEYLALANRIRKFIDEIVRDFDQKD